MIDQKVIVGRMPVHHAHPFRAEFPEIADKASVIPDGQSDGHCEVGPCEQKGVFRARCSGQSREYIHFT